MRPTKFARVIRTLTKREFPVLYAKASTAVATPLLAVVTISYISRAIGQRASDVYPLGMAAFGATAALAAICYAAPQQDAGPRQGHYAAEKFLHSSLLLIQSLMMIYVKDVLANAASHGSRPYRGAIVIGAGLAGGIASLVAAAAAWCWYWGFSVLNEQLWRNWEVRIEKINREAEEPGAPAVGNQAKGAGA